MAQYYFFNFVHLFIPFKYTNIRYKCATYAYLDEFTYQILIKENYVIRGLCPNKLISSSANGNMAERRICEGNCYIIELF